ncbi:DUF2922 family protein [Exiguobacterium flavidum]|uniref:DUF2922 family protein n=1 Tax=Exiguobacterium flavidum TaxID=2184695 RepID=UPI000DF77C52|nr:DUF2922 family protein [Exiguobacterium flavidum]
MEHTILLSFDTAAKKPYRLRITGADKDASLEEIQALGSLFVTHDPFTGGITALVSAELQNSIETPYAI